RRARRRPPAGRGTARESEDRERIRALSLRERAEPKVGDGCACGKPVLARPRRFAYCAAVEPARRPVHTSSTIRSRHAESLPAHTGCPHARVPPRVWRRGGTEPGHDTGRALRPRERQRLLAAELLTVPGALGTAGRLIGPHRV